jgi:penicillin-binding protein 1B
MRNTHKVQRPWTGHPVLLLVLTLALLLPCTAALAGLEQEMGRNEVRIWSAPYTLEPGTTVEGSGLLRRLERLGYRRVHQRPESPGEFFYGHERFWIYRQAHQLDGDEVSAQLISLPLRRQDGLILEQQPPATGDKPLFPGTPEHHWLEPELLTESLEANRAPRIPVRLDELPEHVWRAVLAIEDSRFFDHTGLDARGIARALLNNARAGKVVEGGSTITQQLVKIRDLTPRRTWGRKLSEALRALELEAAHDKEEILQAYLNYVYYGHMDGVSIYGIGTAARAYFSKEARDLNLGEAALLAGIIKGPNLLSPVRNPDRARERQEQVLERMRQLHWAPETEISKARLRGLPKLRTANLRPAGNRHFLGLLREIVERKAEQQVEMGRGVLVESTLDPLLQAQAEEAVRQGLAELRRNHSRLRRLPLAAALVCYDAEDGRILAYVGGDPAAEADAFDRVRNARRQPGSAIKPLILLSAFDGAGEQGALYPARQVADSPLRIDLPSGAWEPHNYNGNYQGTVTIREALVQSLNLPFVRIGRWCGFETMAAMIRETGLTIPDPAPPSLVLGAVEATPLELADAYAIFSGSLGRRTRLTPYTRLARPSGRTITRHRPRHKQVVRPATAYLIRDLLHDAVERGTSRPAAIEGRDVFGKTGSSSGLRDAWFVGGSGPLVAAVWVGIDDDTPLGLTGSGAAAPIWHSFMVSAAPTRPAAPLERPDDVVERLIQDRSGLLVGRSRRGTHTDLFRRGAMPPSRRLWRKDEPIPVLQ